jgi:molecular chaperone IbpA
MVKNNTGTYTSLTNAVSVYDPFKFIDQIWDNSFQTTQLTLQDTYPPYNIREIDEDTRVLELALAGFSKDEIKIEINNRLLTISGERQKEEDVKYIHKGIATRKFSKVITLWEFWEVGSADYNDGILYVVLKREIPEDKKPKTIKIN